MSEIICPHCSKAFSVDETGYANILKQVYDKEFESQLEARMNHANKEKELAIKLAKQDAESEAQALKAKKDID